MSKNFIVMWCNEGIQSVIDIENINHENLIHAVKTGHLPKANINQYLTMMTLHARLNSHRHYEIYIVTADVEISADDIREMFNNNPQYAADVCRKIGKMIYSDRRHQKSVIV